MCGKNRSSCVASICDVIAAKKRNTDNGESAQFACSRSAKRQSDAESSQRTGAADLFRRAI